MWGIAWGNPARPAKFRLKRQLTSRRNLRHSSLRALGFYQSRKSAAARTSTPFVSSPCAARRYAGSRKLARNKVRDTRLNPSHRTRRLEPRRKVVRCNAWPAFVIRRVCLSLVVGESDVRGAPQVRYATPFPPLALKRYTEGPVAATGSERASSASKKHARQRHQGSQMRSMTAGAKNHFGDWKSS
jgi:hypothetical protein